MTQAAARLRVLVADDEPRILKAVSTTLATEFDVIATVADGRQALDAIPRLDPDLVVLDISMPGLNGFQTAAELQRIGSRARIVFLTMHQDDDFVSQALRCGAMGYVLKALVSSDLVPALHHVLAGRRYLPSLTSLVMTGADTHALQLCGEGSSGLDGVAAVLSSALHRGDIVATATTTSNRDGLAVLLKKRGWNLADVGEQGRYLVFDAEEVATRITRAGRADLDSIAEMVAALESARRASATRPHSHLTIAGEISAVLYRRGLPHAALDLERFWDELTRSLPILTICMCPTPCSDDNGAEFLSSISAHHTAISRAVWA
jgi:DNA-binding NarL/FixJ family response regulator